jgi:glycolate oxidase iron-sulfur subunit
VRVVTEAERFAPPEGLHACVHCGLCLSACPTYVELGSEMDSPRGRIQLMQGLESGRLLPSGAVRRHIDRCLGCRACEPACPSGVPYGRLIEAVRPYVERRRSRGARSARRLVVELVASGRGGMVLRLARRLPGLRTLARSLPGMWAAYLAALPDGGDGPSPSAVIEPTGARRGTAALVMGCVADALFPGTNRATALLLALAGVRVVPIAGRCCGALHAHAGHDDRARSLALALARAVPDGVDWVVGTAAGCGSHLRDFAHVAPGEPEASRVAARTRDALSLLAELGLPRARPPDGATTTIAVHDPCHLAHGLGVRDEVRAVLSALPGVRLVELAESDVCCGSAGTYNLTERAMARRLLERKLRNVGSSGAAVVAAANPGCLLQLRAGALKQGLAVRVEHPIDLLAEAHGLV